MARTDPDHVKKIKIAYTQRPIAPGAAGSPCSAAHGCSDDFGDLDTGGLCGREPCGALPFVVPAGVTIEGVPDANGNRPRVTINEIIPDSLSFKNYDWVLPTGYDFTGRPNARRPYFIAEDGVTIKNLEIDGSTYRHKTTLETVGIFVQDSVDVTIKNCVVKDLHDGLVFLEKSSEDEGGMETSAVVEDCEITDCFPGFDYAPLPAEDEPSNVVFLQDHGHAGIWAEVKHNGVSGPPVELAVVNLVVNSTRFERNHDAIETDITGGFALTDIQLSTTDCDFERNENGIEAVSGSGAGGCTIVVDSCRFQSNYNAPACLGGYQSTSVGTAIPTGAIVHRNKNANIYVRNSVFKNNSVAAVLLEAANMIDFGIYDATNPEDIVDSPGNNAFLLDTLPPINGSNNCMATPVLPYSTLDDQPAWVAMLRVDLISSGPQEVHAYGNRWIGSNQFTSSDGCITAPVVSGCTAPSGFSGPVCGLVNFTLPNACQPLNSSNLRNLSLDNGVTVFLGPSSYCPPACGTSPVVPPCPADVPAPTATAFASCPIPDTP
ncbi:MAG: hypothetical protein ACKVWV_04640 [Planctomycetota bacterium]